MLEQLRNDGISVAIELRLPDAFGFRVPHVIVVTQAAGQTKRISRFPVHMKLARRPICLGLLLLLTGLAAASVRSPQVIDHLASRFTPTSAEQSQHYTLSSDSVVDGTTLAVLDGQEEREVQLCGIMTPDVDIAKAHLRQMLSQSKDRRIILLSVASEQPGWVVEAFLPANSSEPDLETHLNTQMLLDGVAVIDHDSVDSCPNGALYKAAEEYASK